MDPMQNVLTSLRESDAILRDLKKYDIEIFEDEEVEQIKFRRDGFEIAENDDPRTPKMLIQDIIDSVKPVKIPITTRAVLQVGMDEDSFIDKLTAWKNKNKHAKILSISPVSGCSNQTLIKYQLP